MLLTGTLALTGLVAELPYSMFSDNLSVVKAAAEGQVYNTQNGVATLGTGTAGITIAGNSGQTLIGKRFNV